MFTLIVFLMLNFESQRVERIDNIVSLEDCQQAGAAAVKAWSVYRSQVQFVCIRGAQK